MADSGSSTATATSPSLTEGVRVWAGVAVGVGVVRFTIGVERIQSESNHQRSHKELQYIPCMDISSTVQTNADMCMHAVADSCRRLVQGCCEGVGSRSNVSYTMK